VQIQNEAGSCWAVTLFGSGVKTNDASRFNGRGG